MELERYAIIEEEYATGFYTMCYLDTFDEYHEQEFETIDEMEDEYNEQWTDGSWDFEFYTPTGHKYKTISSMKRKD